LNFRVSCGFSYFEKIKSLVVIDRINVFLGVFKFGIVPLEFIYLYFFKDFFEIVQKIISLTLLRSGWNKRVFSYLLRVVFSRRFGTSAFFM